MSPPTQTPAPVQTPVQADEKNLDRIRPTRFIAFKYYLVMFISLVLAVSILLVGPIKNYTDVENSVVGLSLDVVVAILFFFIAFLCLIGGELKRLTTLYLITDNKIVRKDGILSKRTQMVPYTQFKSVDLHQNLLERMLHIGTLEIDTGEDIIKIETISHPNKLQELLSQRLGRLSYSQQPKQQ